MPPTARRFHLKYYTIVNSWTPTLSSIKVRMTAVFFAFSSTQPSSILTERRPLLAFVYLWLQIIIIDRYLSAAAGFKVVSNALRIDGRT